MPLTIEELEAKVAELEAEKTKLETNATDNNERLGAAAGIQRAYRNLEKSNPGAAKYLSDLAASRVPVPFWDTTVVKDDKADVIEPRLEDLEPAQMMARLEAKYSEQLEQRVQSLTQEFDAKYNAVAEPMHQMRAKTNEDAVMALIDEQFGPGSFDGAREEMLALAEGSPTLLQTERGLTTLAKAVLADKAHENGLAAGQDAVIRRAQMSRDLYGIVQPGGAKGSDDTMFDDLEFTGDSAVADLATAFERADRAGATLQVSKD
ncbi:MAG: hypothetical protein V3S98_10590 [Dehalococcoidia bacterium]